MEKVEIRTFQCDDLEIRSAEGEPTTIEGYAIKWDKLSSPMWGFREKVAKGAFTSSIMTDNIKALWNHNSDMPLGNTNKRSLTLLEDDVGLRFSLQPPNNSWGNDAMESIGRGDTDGVSFGFITTQDDWDYTDPNMAIRTIMQGELIEISPTPFPAYPDTPVGVRSGYIPQVPTPIIPSSGIDITRKKLDLKMKEGI